MCIRDSSKPKFYALVEFPDPSAAGLHVGHPRSYTALDIVARKKRQCGYNVLYLSLIHISDLRRQVAEVRGKIRALGNVNVGAIEEYKDCLLYTSRCV